MARIENRTRGTILARWRAADGREICQATGEREPTRARRVANQLEAEYLFWEAHKDGLWDSLAALNYSPRYCWDVFLAKGHCRFEKFRRLLGEAGVKFAAKPRDRVTTSKHAKRYPYRGGRRTVQQIIDLTPSCSIGPATLRYRLERGWDVGEAVTTPKLTARQVASMGARARNAKRTL